MYMFTSRLNKKTIERNNAAERRKPWKKNNFRAVRNTTFTGRYNYDMFYKCRCSAIRLIRLSFCCVL